MRHEKSASRSLDYKGLPPYAPNHHDIAHTLRMARKELIKQPGRRVVIVGEGLGILDKLVAAGASHGNSSTDHVDISLFSQPDTHPSFLPLPARSSKSIMSVQLNPPNSLGFRRPLTTLVKRSLTITNNNPQPVAFKVKTTAPKLYCVRPNSGRVEPGESIDVSVMLQALKEEPPLSTKCKDKFLIQSTIITPDKETLPLADIWSSSDSNEEGKVFQQKLRVTYLSAEGPPLEEEDENNQAGMMSMISDGEPPSFETVRQPRAVNGHPTIDSQLIAGTHPYPEAVPMAGQDEVERQESQDSTATAALPVPAIIEPPVTEPEHRPPTPVTRDLPTSIPVSVAEEVVDVDQRPAEEPVSHSEPAPAYSEPAPATSTPQPLVITRENPINEELYAKYNQSMAEIDTLQAFNASLQQQLKAAEEVATAAATPPPASELRRRSRRYSDADSAAPSEAVTMVEEVQIHSDGVPLNVVVVIALVVFVTTYLFF